jgi:arylsulfatase A-like enzyme
MLTSLLACSQPGPLVVLVSLDTVRADALGTYGNRGARTPNMDHLAERGRVYEMALAHSPTTLASHAAMFSGLDSHGHAVVRNGYPVPDELDLLPERFQAAGWDTLAVVGASPLEDAMGLDQGFRVYVDHDLKPWEGQVEVPADAVVRRALSELDAAGEGPTFLFVHLYDAHMPWDSAPAGLRQELVGDYAGPITGTTENILALGDPEFVAGLGPADVRAAQAMYQAEVAWLDQQLGPLLDGLQARRPDLLVALTSDHGECMGPEDVGCATLFGHGPDVDLALLRVPLILHGTGSLAIEPGRDEHLARHQDLGTTLLTRAGLAPASLGSGLDLLAPRPADLSSFAEATKPIERESSAAWNNLPFERSVAASEHLLVASPLRSEARLYRLEPGQTATSDDRLGPELVRQIQDWDRAAPAHREPEMSDEMREALIQLGYLERAP